MMARQTSDLTPEDWRAGSTGELESNPTVAHPAPEFEALAEAARERIRLEHELMANLK